MSLKSYVIWRQLIIIEGERLKLTFKTENFTGLHGHKCNQAQQFITEFTVKGRGGSSGNYQDERVMLCIEICLCQLRKFHIARMLTLG